MFLFLFEDLYQIEVAEHRVVCDCAEINTPNDGESELKNKIEQNLLPPPQDIYGGRGQVFSEEGMGGPSE